jgi:glycosyltransferase involved in cell wall biosynthesis
VEIPVVFAAYNEEKNVESAMTRALDAVRSRSSTFEIIAVDDASTGSTGAPCNFLTPEALIRAYNFGCRTEEV